ncbi:SbcC/MukB-like Walker B domain-containing protein [Modestobacter sp. Leaf380]|uniref:SbcC/MukB-like Walker B domain-containing protein n=1 Tax=Modestobacter sp. Leaf380 TaxID=1736356 RepID=UPI0006FBA58B|nr:SbcC/MukB-like Walker B domain-containing protein [Modestobacter sp. Leaf380]KQS69266.1 hypothetical protein ASG41_21880 [Modestobacter sp. Leaf380]
MSDSNRWRLHRAGIQNVWHYWDAEFVLSGGRMVLRGTNGSGKSRALELLLPFLLDADRRRMDSSGSGSVSLDRLMRVGGREVGNRVGYLWVELAHGDGTGVPVRFLTLGAHLKWSAATGTVKVHWFTTDHRVGHDLHLLDGQRQALRREDLTRQLGPEQVTDSADTHREKVRSLVFGLVDARAEERFEGLTQLLHTLRSPDVGNRIDEGRLPALLSDALPPLSQATLDAAGAKLDEISETRALQERLERSVADLETFLASYRRYAQGELGAATAQARSAVRDRGRADRAEATARVALTTAEEAAAQGAARYAQCTEQLAEVQATLAGLRQSAERQDLLERARTVTALRTSADGAADRAWDARAGEEQAATRVAGAVDDAEAAGARASGQLTALAEKAGVAGVPDPLPSEVPLRRVELAGAVDAVRLRPDRDAEPLARPAMVDLDLGDADLEAWRTTAGAVRQAARDRRHQLEGRLVEHRRLRDAERAVLTAENRRDQAAEREQAARVRREAAVGTESAAGGDLRGQWLRWARSPDTTEHLGDVEWSGTVGGWLGAAAPDDVDTVVPDTAALGATVLDELDGAAQDAAADAAERLSTQRADLRRRKTILLDRAADLGSRRDRLVAEQDPDPTALGWVTAAAGTPLWRAVDFAPDVDPEQHAGIEAALIGAGLLTAAVGAAGATGPSVGELLVDASSPRAQHPLSTVLVPDPDGGLPAGQVTDVLDRIGWADRSGSCWVDVDGSFRLGSLTGRHDVPHARHIGTTARARHRAEQLALLETELREVAAETATVAAGLSEAADRTEALRRYVRTAPRTTALREAGTRRRSADADLAREAAETVRLSQVATGSRSAWDVDHLRHTEACGRLGLPADDDRLAAARDRAGDTVTAAENVSAALGDLARAVRRVRADQSVVQTARAHRVAAETGAEQDRSRWHEAATELAAAELVAGLDADAARAELAAAEREVGRARAAHTAADAERLDTAQAASSARRDAENAAVSATATRTAAATAEDRLRHRAELPGLAEAAGLSELPTAGPLVDVLTAGLPDPVPDRDPDGYQKALLELNRRRDPGDYDLLPSVADGVNLVEIGEAAGRRSLPGAVAELVRRRDLGRAALTEKEQRVFTTFVLGTVADELRQQLLWSLEQVDRMNDRLAGIRTSHGIGVEIRWPLAEDAAGSAARIEELVLTRASARSVDANAELTTLLRGRVEEELRGDPAQGYATALRAALDHRSWHTVEVYILGPGKDERRKISRRARLSQGETRVVSYLALFAAADAFFTGLPDPEALRLILLDDAFAKVDEPTIGELMAQLVRLDLDFVMTGHALWGFGPGVPALDVYEVRRAEGTSAITTRVHWDGTSRHVFG